MKLPDNPASFKAKKLGEITISVSDIWYFIEVAIDVTLQIYSLLAKILIGIGP